MKLSADTKNTFGYKGEVQITFKCNGVKLTRTIHNTGTQFLFDIITQFLAGYDVSQNVPAYVDILDGSSSEIKRRIPLTGIVWGAAASESYNPNAEALNSAGYIKLTATVTNNDKSSKTTLSSPSIQIQDKLQNILCTIQDSTINDMWEAINPNTDAIIDWLLIFRNQGN